MGWNGRSNINISQRMPTTVNTNGPGRRGCPRSIANTNYSVGAIPIACCPSTYAQNTRASVSIIDCIFEFRPSVSVADGLFCREIDGLFCRSSPDIIVRRRCVLSHKRRGWLQPSPSFRYSRNLALQDELYHPVINNGPAVLVCVDKRLGTGPVNQSRDAG